MTARYLLHPTLPACSLLLVFALACDSPNVGGGSATDGSGNPTTGDGGNGGGSSGDDSVGDVFDGNGGGVPAPAGAAQAAARIRNERASRCDVTLRFIRDDAVVHLAFARVLPEMVTSVQSPEAVDTIEVSGQDGEGNSLAAAALVFGRDFDGTSAGEYIIRAISPPQSGDGSGDSPDPGPVDPPSDGGDPTPVPVPPPTIVLLEPTEDQTVTLGTTFVIKWADSSADPGAVVSLSLRQVDGSSTLSLGPAVGAALDGINDQMTVIAQSVSPGDYRVVARIDANGEFAVDESTGLIHVTADPSNVAPQLTILSPTSQSVLEASASLSVAWADEDPDDNATILFSLVPAESADVSLGTFQIGPPVAEDPDGANADRLTVGLGGVLPGEYDLVGEIDDGELAGSARITGAVKVVAVDVPANDSPQLVLVQPAVDTAVDPGGSFLVAWTDSDANDNARIAIMLDPDFGAVPLDGDELLLAASINEDEDGLGDRLSLGVPLDIASGTYRVVGVITDGLSQLTVQAPGLVVVVQTSSSGEPPADDPLPIPSLAMHEPSVPLRTRAGDSFLAQLSVTDLPYNADIQFFLSNVRANGISGDVTLDVTPADFTWAPNTGAADDGATTEVTLNIAIPSDGSLPNLAWPRNFDLKAVASVGGVEYSAEALGQVWVRQEVQVLSAEMINYWCTPAGGNVQEGVPFTGLELLWTGGGFGDDNDVLDIVNLWLTMDGVIPENGQNDDTHRLIHHSSVEGPNQIRFTQVGVNDAFGFEYTRVGDYLVMGMELDAGTYSIVPVVDDEWFRRVVSAPAEEPVDVCFPLPNAQISLEP